MDQRQIVLYNPAISSLNIGDHIIFDGVYNQLEELLNKAFVVDISTHLPVSSYIKRTKDFDYKFVCGSNLIRGKMNKRFRQWDINIFNASYVGPCILVGVGWWQYGDEPNFYTKKLYKRVLSSNYNHSVRDSYTEMQFRKMGLDNVINTGCPTMWALTNEHCLGIPKGKSQDVVCTITDYNQDILLDKKMIEILCENYQNVFLWLQGVNDLNYYNRLNIENSKVKIVPPNLKAYDLILERDVDFIGTRLHAGIRALQKKKRTIIIAIDNRALEKSKDFNLKILERENIDDLSNLIYSNFSTEVNIPIENIKKWKEQFGLKIQ